MKPPLVSFSNPKVGISINNFKLCTDLKKISPLCPCMDLLYYILSRVDNTAAVGRINKFIFSTTSAVGPLLHKIFLCFCHFQVHTSTCHITDGNNDMADDTSRLTHLSDTTFFNTYCPPTYSQYHGVSFPCRPNARGR